MSNQLFADVADYLGATLLHWAAYHDDATLAAALLALGADPVASSLDTPPPLFVAALRGSTDVLTLLIGTEAGKTCA
jgi:ankyrin repeat protein